MNKNTHLYILWTNNDPETAEKMVFMYALNSRLQNWWDEITLIIWGSTAILTAENLAVQEQIRSLQENGVQVSACRSCADQFEVVETLENLDIEVIYWGEPLTKILKNGGKLLTL